MSEMGTVFDKTDDPGSPLVQEFYRGYERSFVLPDETEDLNAFKACLSLNHGECGDSLRDRFGDFREYVAVMRSRHAPGSAMVGGANFIVMPLAGRAGSPDVVTVHLNYSFVLPAYRRKGYLRALIRGVRSAASQFATGHEATRDDALIIFEQNDPFLLTAEEEAADTRAAGISQLERVGVWMRLGAAILDFAYVQPPLSAGKRPEHRLALGILGLKEAGLDSCILYEHLRRFFAISVLKGKEPEEEPTAAQQLRFLAQECTRGRAVGALFIDGGTYDRLAGTWQERRGETSLRDALRTLRQ